MNDMVTRACYSPAMVLSLFCKAVVVCFIAILYIHFCYVYFPYSSISQHSVAGLYVRRMQARNSASG